MIKFWYDIATLNWRYMESGPAWNGGHSVVLHDGGYEHVPHNQALEVGKYSRVVMEPQELLDAIIAAGFKPNKMEGTPGHVAALEKHIAFAESVVNKVLT